MSRLNIVLYEPEIPQNAGNIMRTCVATKATLHFIRPLGFHLDEAHIKRSGVNYIEHLEYYIYDDYNDFLKKRIEGNDKARVYYLTRYGEKSIYDVDAKDLDKEYYLVLGKESTGIPKEILVKDLDHCIRLPMSENVRALNVSNVAAIMAYEVLRQQGFPDLMQYEPDIDDHGHKGKDYLER